MLSSRCAPAPRRAGPLFPGCPGIRTALGVAAVRQPQTQMTWARGRPQGARHPQEELPNPLLSASASAREPTAHPQLPDSEKTSAPRAPGGDRAAGPGAGATRVNPTCSLRGRGPGRLEHLPLAAEPARRSLAEAPGCGSWRVPIGAAFHGLERGGPASASYPG